MTTELIVRSHLPCMNNSTTEVVLTGAASASTSSCRVLTRSKSEGDLLHQNSTLRPKESNKNNNKLAAAAKRISSPDDHEELLITSGFTQYSHDHQATRISDHHVVNVAHAAAAAADHHLDLHLTDPQSVVHRDSTRGSTVVMKYLVLTLLAPVGIIYQERPDVLMSEYTVQFWCFIGAVCTYWATMKIVVSIRHLTPKSNFNTLNCIGLACEVLAVISLVSVLLPHDVSLFVFFASIYSVAVSFVVILTYIYWFVPRHATPL